MTYVLFDDPTGKFILFPINTHTQTQTHTHITQVQVMASKQHVLTRRSLGNPKCSGYLMGRILIFWCYHQKFGQNLQSLGNFRSLCDNLTVVIRFFQESLSFPQFPPFTDNGHASLVIAFLLHLSVYGRAWIYHCQPYFLSLCVDRVQSLLFITGMRKFSID